jgi:hypothetical protein
MSHKLTVTTFMKEEDILEDHRNDGQTGFESQMAFRWHSSKKIT